MNNVQMDEKLNDLLARYAAGQLPLSLHVLVASHLSMRETNRNFVSCLEALSAQDIENIAPVPLSDRQKCLSAIFDSPSFSAQPKAQCLLPKPLHDFLGQDLAQIKWHRLLPGVKEFTIQENDGVEANLYLIKAGHRIPIHTHEGSEVTLVLKGAFFDSTGNYACGDISIADGELNHSPEVTKDEDCLCFAVTDAPLRLTGPIGRMFNRFMRH